MDQALAIKTKTRIRSERRFQLLLSFPRGTEMFHFPPCASSYKDFCRWQKGFPIRKFPGQRYLAPHRNLSQPYHVLHRFLKPRHSPYTLFSCKEHWSPKWCQSSQTENAHRCAINLSVLLVLINTKIKTNDLCDWFVVDKKTLP